MNQIKPFVIFGVGSDAIGRRGLLHLLHEHGCRWPLPYESGESLIQGSNTTQFLLVDDIKEIYVSTEKVVTYCYDYHTYRLRDYPRFHYTDPVIVKRLQAVLDEPKHDEPDLYEVLLAAPSPMDTRYQVGERLDIKAFMIDYGAWSRKREGALIKAEMKP
jgi:hypothetical protein